MRQFVGVVLVKSDGSVLSQHRDNIPNLLGRDTWSAVGGLKETVDRNLKAAAARELREETGYIIDPERLEQLTGDIYINERGETVERTIFWDWYNGSQTINTNEGQEIRFISPGELGSLKFYTGHEGFLRAASEKAFGGEIERK